MENRSPNNAVKERSPLLENRACYAACSSASECSTPCYLCHGGQCVPGRKEKERDLNYFESRAAQSGVEERSALFAGEDGLDIKKRALCGASCSSRSDCAGSGCPLCIRGSVSFIL